MTTTDETTGQAAEDWWERLYAEAETTEPVQQPVPVAPVRTGRLRDWWQKPDGTELQAAADVEPERVEVEEEPVEEPGDNPGLSSDDEAEPVTEGRWFRTQTGYYPTRESLVPSLPARPAISPGTRRLIFNGTAAGAGYWFGLTPRIVSWIEACGTATSIGGALVLGAGICLVTAHFWDRRTRHWMPGLRWVARIPLMSAITALALYAPAASTR
ncbi:hypothetical protein [Streptomyces sp. NPDC056132]|uniref:hypothetical protein n=1 Tax=Streptomyces sp. NPDC056132 TaxID=3345722 RepID=UPI0035E171DD